MPSGRETATEWKKKQYGNTSDIYTVTKISLISDDLQMGGALFEPETIAGIKRPQP